MHKDVGLIIDKICRCCMCENDNMHSMFNLEKGTENSERVPLSEMLIACASIEISSEDGLPNNLCDSCEQKLKVAYEFRTLCQKSDTALRELRTNEKKGESNDEEAIEIQPDVHNDLFDEDDDIPLSQRNFKRKRGRPKKLEVEELSCTYCSKLFTKSSLKVHLRTHTSEKLKKCLFCEAKYSRNNHLVRHLAMHDKVGEQHPCEHCDKTFELAVELYKHSREHDVVNERENIKVEGGTATIKTEAIDIGEHKLENVSNDFQDDSTPADFYVSDADDRDDGDNFNDSDDELITNKKDVIEKSGEKTLYECKHCLKILTTYLGYKIHLRRHTGSGLVECKVCNKSFTKQNHLSRHMITHGFSEEKHKVHRRSEGKAKVEIPCEYCDRKFKYRKSFKHHVKVEHGMSDVESDVEKLNDIDDENNKEKENQLEESGGNVTEALAPSIPVTWNEFKSKDSSDLFNGTTEDYPLEQPNMSSQKVEPNEDMTFDDSVENDEEDMEPLTIDEQFSAKKSRSKNQVCHVCGATFARVNHLTRHMTLHRALLVHQCSRCEKAFSTEDHLKAHVEEEHINKPYVCTVCNKHFSRGEHLIRHLKVHQSNNEKEENLKCSICESTFTRSDHLARHTKIHLLQDKRHVCVECGKAFNRLDNLKTHQRIHTGIKDTSKLHLCIYCGKEFNNSSNMIVHMRRHTGERPYKCNVCGKGFPRSHDLKCHERTHSGEKPYLCTLCGKSFNKSNKLLRHSRVHTGERPYVCNICGRAFTQSNDLALHMRRHTGARPYACGVCPARFIQSGQLKAHRRTTGHWMETQPDLKGGHRVEPVTPAHEPMPIKFKSQRYNDSRLKKEHVVVDQELPKPLILATAPPTDPSVDHHQHHHHHQSPVVALNEVQAAAAAAAAVVQNQPQRILMGIMGNIKLPNESLIIDGSKLVELHTSGLVNLPSVIQTANGEEIKLKSEVGNFTIAQVEEVVAKNEAAESYQDATVIYSSVGHTSTTFTTTENFNFQNYH